MRSFSTICTILAATTTVSADLMINNHCDQTIYVWQNNAALQNCDKGPNGICTGSPGAAAWPIYKHTSLPFEWINNNAGTAVKISKQPTAGSAMLQFEYTMNTNPEEYFPHGKNFWDLSDLDGITGGKTGTPFSKENVRVTTSLEGQNDGGSYNCCGFTCKAYETCADAYQTPWDTATRFCYPWVKFVLDLCWQDGMTDINPSKRELKFIA